MFCSACGHSNAAGSMSCSKCGSPLAGAAAPAGSGKVDSAAVPAPVAATQSANIPALAAGSALANRRSRNRNPPRHRRCPPSKIFNAR